MSSKQGRYVCPALVDVKAQSYRELHVVCPALSIEMLSTLICNAGLKGELQVVCCQVNCWLLIWNSHPQAFAVI